MKRVMSSSRWEKLKINKVRAFYWTATWMRIATCSDMRLDFLKHQFTGGTNPIDIHEYIVHRQKGVDLGYELRPRTEGPSPVVVAQPKRARLRQVKGA